MVLAGKLNYGNMPKALIKVHAYDDFIATPIDEHIYEGEHYVNEDRYFISEKTYKGRKLKALEYPGLWNGAMHNWNTIFVEVPLATFNPVKTVNDLLRDGHR